MTDSAICWNCAAPLGDLPANVSRHEYCEQCAEPVHCCRMCAHFAPNLAHQCREDRTEPPVDKTCANFCDFFSLRRGTGGAGERDERQARARARLDALFGDDSSDS